MTQDIALKEIDERIRLMKKTAEELQQMSSGFPALQKNTARILAGIKMLELNVSDVLELDLNA